jgi:hypothetical protein
MSTSPDTSGKYLAAYKEALFVRGKIIALCNFSNDYDSFNN